MDKGFYRDLFLLLLCPIVAFFIIVNEIYKGNLNRLVLLSLFMAFVGCLTIPFADCSRNMFIYFSLIKNPVGDILYYENGKDFVLYSLSNLLAKYNLPFEWIKGLFTFICYQSSFLLFKDLLKVNPSLTANKKRQFMVFLIFFFTVPFGWILSGLRYGTAAYLSLLAWHYYLSHKKIKCILLFFLSVGTHFGVLYILPVFVYMCFPLFKITKKWFVILLIVFIAFGNIMIMSLAPGFFSEENGMDKTFNTYVVNSEQNFSETTSILGTISLYIMQLFPLYVMGFISVFKNGVYQKDTLSKIYMILLFIIIVSPFDQLFNRYGYSLIPVIIYLGLSKVSDDFYTNKILRWLFFSSVIVFVAYVYGFRGIFLYSPFHYLFFPFMFILSHYYTLADAIKYIKSRT